MKIIDNTLISDELYQLKFACDYSSCKGRCCREGDTGAPLEETELSPIRSNFSGFKSFLTASGLSVLEKEGFYSRDEDGHPVTPLIEGKECAYAYREQGVYSCAIERAFFAGKIDFQKPISCHLFPLRIKKFQNGMLALNYEKWNICQAALKKGEKEDIRGIDFLKDGLIRKFGVEWFRQAASE